MEHNEVNGEDLTDTQLTLAEVLLRTKDTMIQGLSRPWYLSTVNTSTPELLVCLFTGN